MTLYPSDGRFAVGGQHHKGFPILVDASGVVVEVVLCFFVDELLGRSGARDLKTWTAYGRHLLDYFGYLENKGLCWNYIPGEGSGDVSPLAHYVRWCDATVGNKPSYINSKRATIERFYTWALRVGLINDLPSSRSYVPSSDLHRYVTQASEQGGRRAISNLHVRTAEEPIKVLSRNQIDITFRAATNPTSRAQLHLGLNAGLRAEELATFPKRYVVDCSKFSSKIRTVPVTLDPAHMSTKNNKKRVVRVSVYCMNLLWQYLETARPRLQKRGSDNIEHDALFLTRFGRPFVEDGLVAPLARLGKRLGFHIHPHMLRHTFATHTLASLDDLKRRRKLKSSPLLILKQMLGHSSINTTSRYVHFLDSIDDIYGTSYQAEIDALALGYLSEGQDR